MQGNGGILNYEIYTPARTLDVIFPFLRGIFRCRAMFLVEYLNIDIDNNLQLVVVDLCDFWCPKPLGPQETMN